MLAALKSRLLRWMRPRRAEALPIVLDRRRIYILPTGFGLFLAVVLGAMLLGALNYNNNPALLLGFLLAATALLSLHAGHLALSGIGLRLARGQPVHAGEPLSLTLQMDAKRSFPRTGLVLEVDGTRTVFALPGIDPVDVELNLPTTTRGWLHPGRIRISTTQPLGLARAWAYFWPEQGLLVYPALETHTPPLPTFAGAGTHGRVLAQGEEPHHLRNYRVGDPPRQVAWKASARANKLLVREYEARSDRDLKLDWHALTGLAHEARIRRLASWVVQADRLNVRYRLSLPAQAIGPGQGHAHRHACLRALALLPHD